MNVVGRSGTRRSGNRLKLLGILKQYPGSIDQIVDLINDWVVWVVRVLEVK
jgi:hypothetical protein